MGRKLELLISILMLILTFPLFAFACALTLIQVGRPVFNSKPRSGLCGKTFYLTKLRTTTDSIEVPDLVSASNNRFVPLSKAIRRSRTDEFPQLFSILKGEMALVGPRPMPPKAIRELSHLGQQRCTVRPGLAGWAQICGNTNLSKREKLDLDLWYIAHRSTALDFKILAESLIVVLFGEHRREKRIRRAELWVKNSSFENFRGR